MEIPPQKTKEFVGRDTEDEIQKCCHSDFALILSTRNAHGLKINRTAVARRSFPMIGIF